MINNCYYLFKESHKAKQDYIKYFKLCLKKHGSYMDPRPFNSIPPNLFGVERICRIFFRNPL